MRLLNRPLALLLALAVAVTAAVVVIEVIAVVVHAHHVVVPWQTWSRWARRTHWNYTVVKVWGVILIVIGGLLLLLELKRPRVSRLRVHTDNDSTDAAMTRPGLAGAVRAAVLDIDGISKARVSVGRRSVKVLATAIAHDRAAIQALDEPVGDAARGRIDELALMRPLRVRSHVTSGQR